MAKPARTGERRRVSRDEGMGLLLGAAMDVARNQGQLKEGVRVAADTSRISRQSITLCTRSGRQISRVSIQDARRMLAFRRQVARQALRQAGATVRSDSTATVERRTIRIQEEGIRALAWAISTGRRFPVPPAALPRRLTNLGLVVLASLWLCSVLLGWPGGVGAVLLCGLVALLVLWWRQAQRQKTYQHALEELVQRWRMIGRPDPANSFFAHYDL